MDYDYYDDKEAFRLEREMREEEYESKRQSMYHEWYNDAKQNDHLIKCKGCNGTGIEEYRGVNMLATDNPVFPCCMDCKGNGELLYSDPVLLDIEMDEWERDRKECDRELYGF